MTRPPGWRSLGVALTTSPFLGGVAMGGEIEECAWTSRKDSLCLRNQWMPEFHQMSWARSGFVSRRMTRSVVDVNTTN